MARSRGDPLVKRADRVVSTPASAVHGVVLAGGGGSRLGQPKPSADLCGRPLVSFPVEAFRAAGLEVTVLAKAGVDILVEVDVINEPQTPLHPLLGIVTALESIEQSIVVCACDMPFVTPELIKWIAGRSESPVVVPQVAGRLQPMFGRYSPDATPALRDALDAERSVRVAIETAGLTTVDESELVQFGDPARLLFDVDTPDDLSHAAEVVRSEREIN